MVILWQFPCIFFVLHETGIENMFGLRMIYCNSLYFMHTYCLKSLIYVIDVICEVADTLINSVYFSFFALSFFPSNLYKNKTDLGNFNFTVIIST